MGVTESSLTVRELRERQVVKNSAILSGLEYLRAEIDRRIELLEMEQTMHRELLDAPVTSRPILNLGVTPEHVFVVIPFGAERGLHPGELTREKLWAEHFNPHKEDA